MLYTAVLVLTISVTLCAGYQYCYECSSKSALCRNSVYDGHYLTKTPCKSVCFYRNEDNRVFRGCFDGWLGGIVRNDYLGCRTQRYLGDKVEWCFCNGTSDATSDEPCNGVHRDVIAKLGQPEERVTKVKLEQQKEEQEEQWGSNPRLRTRSKYFLPERRAPEGRELKPEMMDEEKDDVSRESLGDRFEDDTSHRVAPTPVTTPQPPSLCFGRYDGPYPDDTDCSRYVLCSHGRPYRMHCSAGTVWNDALKTCVYFAAHASPIPCVLPKRFKHFQYFQEREPIEVHEMPLSDYNANYDVGTTPND